MTKASNGRAPDHFNGKPSQFPNALPLSEEAQRRTAHLSHHPTSTSTPDGLTCPQIASTLGEHVRVHASTDLSSRSMQQMRPRRRGEIRRRQGGDMHAVRPEMVTEDAEQTVGHRSLA